MAKGLLGHSNCQIPRSRKVAGMVIQCDRVPGTYSGNLAVGMIGGHLGGFWAPFHKESRYAFCKPPWRCTLRLVSRRHIFHFVALVIHLRAGNRLGNLAVGVIGGIPSSFAAIIHLPLGPVRGNTLRLVSRG